MYPENCAFFKRVGFVPWGSRFFLPLQQELRSSGALEEILSLDWVVCVLLHSRLSGVMHRMASCWVAAVDAAEEFFLFFS